MVNLNAELYSKALLDEWSKKNHLLEAENKLLKKYLKDTTGNVLDVGTGGGRLAFYVESMGFTNISAFDIVPEMIEHARIRGQELNSKVNFTVADAARLDQFENETFDYLLYLQQVLNFIPNEKLFYNALEESYRLTKLGGIVFFSFLDYNSRIINKPLNMVVNLLRIIRNEKVEECRLPWLKINDRFNWKLFNKNQAQVYWVHRDNILSRLEKIGYTILEVKNSNQFKNKNTSKRKGMLYVVCKKIEHLEG